MDIALITGLLIAVILIGVGMIISGANILSYISLDSLLIVLGGTIGTTLAGVTLKQGLSIFKSLIKCVKPPKIDWEGTISQFVELATIARRDGVIMLQDKIDSQENDLVRAGLQLIVDGADSDILFLVVSTRIGIKKEEDKVAGDIFSTMGAYAPGFGLLGTVLGLIMVLGNLSEPEKLGAGIAQAFLTTLYGIIFANLFFLPIANKMKLNTKEYSRYYEMLLAGLMSIQEGDNPLLLEEKLKAYCPDKFVEEPVPGDSGDGTKEGEMEYGSGELQAETT